MQQPTSSLAVPAASEPHSHRPSAPTRRQRGGGGGGTAAEAERFYTAAEEEQEQEGEQEAASLPPPPPPPPQQQPRPPSKNGNNNHDDWEWMLDGGACAGFGSGGDEGGKERARSKEGGGGGGENENDENENEKTRSTSIFAAVEFSRGHLGFAWLDVNRRELLVAHSPDDAEGPHVFSTLSKALRFVRPAVVHASERADSRLLAFLEKAATTAATENDGGERRSRALPPPPPPFSLALERAGLFAQDAALSALSYVRVIDDDDEDDDGDEKEGEGNKGGEKENNVNFNLNSCSFSSSSSSYSPPLAGRLSLVDSPAQVSAAGALVSIALSASILPPPTSISSSISNSDLNSNLLILSRVAESPLPGLLSVDASTLAELRVFAAEQHPGAGMLGLGGGGDGGGGSSHSSSSFSKEGLSVFGLVGAKCATAAGRKVLRRWLACPLSEVCAIEERLDAVESLVRLAGEGGGGGFGGGRGRRNEEENDESVVAKLQRHLRRRGATSTPAALRRLAASHGLPDPRDFSLILNGIAAAVEAGEELAGAFEDENDDDDDESDSGGTQTTTEMAKKPRIPPLLARLADAAVDPLLHSARALVSGALDVPSALAGGRLAAPGVLPALDSLVAAFGSLPAKLDRVVAAEVARIEEVLLQQQNQQFGNAAPSSSSNWSCVYMPQIGFLMAFDGSGDNGETSSLPAFSSLPPLPSSLPGDYELAFSAGTGAVMPLSPQRPAATSILFTVGGGTEGGGATATERGGQRRERRRRRKRRSDENDDDDDDSNENEASFALASSSAGAYYRCASTRALDARFGDILNRIRDAEAALAAEVVKRLVSSSSSSSSSRSLSFSAATATTTGAAAGENPSSTFAPPPAAAMARAAAAAAEVDALCALALTARERGWSRPRVVEEPVLWLRGARHPLLELVVPDFIPIDVEVGPASSTPSPSPATPQQPQPPCALVITGAAGSGKSATARAAALAALLAHAGSFVPAAPGSTVGLADRLFAVGSGCSSSSSSSSSSPALGPLSGGSLARSLSSVASALRLSTPKSIVVLDECGAGTLSSDGAGVAAAAAALLGSKGVRALLPTHHGELAQSSLMARLDGFGFRSLAERVGVAAMRVLAREVEEEGDEEVEGEGEEVGKNPKTKTLVIIPLFRLEAAPDGPAPAYGLAAAAAAGMPAYVVRRAAEVAAAASSRGKGKFKSSSSACDPRLSAACARDAQRAASLLARVATLPLASVQDEWRLCEEARALLEEVLLVVEGED